MSVFGRKLKSRLVSSILLGGAVALAASAPGLADDLSLKDTPFAGDKLEWSAYAQGTNDYIFRGISQNRREPALQGGLDVSYGMFYVGTFFSGVNFADRLAAAVNNLDSHVEVDLYGGIKPKWGPVTFDFGVIAYTYPATTVSHPYTYDPTYFELKAGASGTVLKDVAVSGTLYYSPDYSGEVGPSLTVEGAVSKPIYTYGEFEFAASGTLGHIFFDKSQTPAVLAGSAFGTTPLVDYTYGNIGLTTTIKKNWSVDLRFWDTDLSTGKSPCGADTSVFQCGPAFVATAKVAF